MIKAHYSETIKGTAEQVFTAMLGLENKETYAQWTAEFNPTSTYEGTWAKGEKVFFVGCDDKGNREGMVSKIAEFIPNKFVSISHYGLVKGDIEITEGPEVEQWAGGFENYTFSEADGVTTVKIDIDIVEEYKDFFNDTWPKALKKLKEIVEG